MEHAATSPKQAEHNKAGALHRGSAAEATPALHPALVLQQQSGNQAMQALLRTGVIHAKLSISQPGDPDEQEADAVAARVMRSHAGAEAATAESCSCGNDEEGMCDECRQKAGIARKATAAGPSPAASHSVLGALRHSHGSPLDARARAFFEPKFGHDFSHVRIHTDAEAARSARSIQAHAFTTGSEIYFASGQFAPYTEGGQHLLAHELTHVVQGTQSTAADDAVRRKYDDPYTLDPSQEPAWNSLEGRDLDQPIWQKAFESTLSAAPQAALDTEKDLQKTPTPVTDAEKEKAVAQIRTLIRLNALGLMASNRSGVERKRDEMLQQGQTKAPPAANQPVQNGTAENAKAIRAAAKEAVELGQKKELLESSEQRLRSESMSQVHGGSFADAFKSIIDETNPYRSDDIRQYFAAFSQNLNATQSLDRGMQVAIIFNMGRYLADWRHKQAGGVMVALNQIYEQFPFLTQLAPQDVPKEGESTDEQLMEKVRGAFKDLLSKIDVAITKIGAGDIDPFDLPEAVKETEGSLSPDLKQLLADAMEHHKVIQFWTDMGLTLAQVVLVFVPIVGPALAAALGVGQLAATVSDMVDRYEVASASTSPEGGVLGVIGPSKLEWAMLGVQAALTAADLGGLWKEINAGRAHFTEAEPRLREGEEEPQLTDRERDSETGNDRGESGESRPGGENPEVDRIPGEEVEPLAGGGEARVTEGGVCKICHSPCEREVQMVRDLLDRAKGTPYEGYVENLFKRIQALEGAMVESSTRNELEQVFNSRYRASFNKLSNEIDITERKLFGGGEDLQHGPIEDIHGFESGREHGIMDEPFMHNPERAMEGTAFHEHIEEAVAAKLPAGSAYTENTIQDFLLQKGIKKSELPGRSSGIDLYVIDRGRGVVTPVDITGVAGGKGHVGKLMKDADKMRQLFDKAGLHMAEPFEIEYAGDTFASASKSVVDELKALAR